jgi:hypothetical protein
MKRFCVHINNDTASEHQDELNKALGTLPENVEIISITHSATTNDFSTLIVYLIYNELEAQAHIPYVQFCEKEKEFKYNDDEAYDKVLKDILWQLGQETSKKGIW